MKEDKTLSEYMNEEQLVSRTKIFTIGMFGAFLGALIAVCIMILGLL